MLRKSIDQDNEVLFAGHYPYLSHQNLGKREAMLGIGGNIGDVVRRFEHLFTFLNRSALVHIKETSPILKNPPFGYMDQEDFYNALIRIETDLTPKALLRYILKVEKRFGRKRLFKDGPRTLDIDIIFYENMSINDEKLTIPHPHWFERDSVLIPLAYLKGYPV
ncbi:2-amino-4-hydroxy-6-hydroxymethyldihydropteridine diphosphokinase [Sulfurovum sp. zt1-1]|uniref:2-amino-4-hydroxy-6-hydroxymethyldihydropteridine pyrophosphokinase n=1 Tax=Sulfurovum zhangzhouensis TaxID=3019067 RepID=A0ABT7QYH3_9BACT|nr:2-amino-4-hydroxy-6-hydroxymethyldihydropteridine diphosphokinase [Sulfurovum zhangzhouensis]MDM5271816.1 2-amino-4-hydroxy-6-hydroxymethyldihydropteridine diphosphokinase [Sulfurovum zhangzhouensis]